MSNKQNEIHQQQIDKLEKDKFEEIVVYTIDFGSYHKFSTTDKSAAYALWESICGEFFQLEQVDNSRYKKPHFKYREPIEVKLSATTEQVWENQESAMRAYNAFKALSNKSKQD